MQTLTTTDTTIGKRKVDVRRGELRTDLAMECWKRPDDERFLSMDALIDHLGRRAETGAEYVKGLGDLTFLADVESDYLGVSGPDGERLSFNHWSMGQMAQQVGAPGEYLRNLPSNVAALNLQASAARFGDQAKLYYDTERDQVRAVTSPSYGRITDLDVVDRLRVVAQDSDVNWKVPGQMDWATGSYDPHAPVTLQSTTLFAGDRDCAVFLCDDLDPIEVGKLENGDPDLMFRGIFCRNSEVGAAKLEIMTMYLRGVCANRCLWGVEGFQKFEILHTQYGPDKYRDEVLPFLNETHSGDKQRVVDGVKLAKEPIPALTTGDAGEKKEAQIGFLKDLGFNTKIASDIIGHEAPGTVTIETPWDVANQLTSFAQTMPYQDKRLQIETIAGTVLDKVISAA